MIWRHVVTSEQRGVVANTRWQDTRAMGMNSRMLSESSGVRVSAMESDNEGR